jgi:hypothetical protein
MGDVAESLKKRNTRGTRRYVARRELLHPGTFPSSGLLLSRRLPSGFLWRFGLCMVQPRSFRRRFLLILGFSFLGTPYVVFPILSTGPLIRRRNLPILCFPFLPMIDHGSGFQASNELLTLSDFLSSFPPAGFPDVSV